MSYDEATAFRALLATTPDLISFFDREGRYCYVSASAAVVRGRTAESLVGLTPVEAGIDPALVERFDRRRVEVMSTGHSIRRDVTHDDFIFEFVMAPVIDGGETLGVVVVTRDVTQRRRAEQALQESEAKFSIAFDRSPLALTITSLDDGRLVEINEGFTAMTGYTRDQAVGRTPEELGLWIDPQQRAERFVRLRAGLPVPNIEARFRMKDGDERIGVVGSSVVDINGRQCVLSSVVDITERKRAEQAKDEFLGTLSHELRTPLTAGYGWIKLLAKTHDPELLGTGLHAIEESLVTQIKLIDELLDVSRIAAGKMHVESQPIDLGVVVDSAVEMVGASVEAKRLALRVHVDSVLTVLGDAARLKQVVWNLLTNAIKFTPASGTIDVSLRQRDGSAELVIRDSGEGIDPQFLPHVFDRFRQADSSINRRHGGLGIGLAIVSSLVDAHGGTVRAESDGPGKGATFTVTLPLLEQRPRVLPSFAQTTAPKATTLTGIRVLVVDDDSGARTLMTTTLRSAGAEVRQCSSASEAFDAVAEWRPTILVSDLAMPDEDGYSLIRRLRASGHDLPAVAITAYVRSEDEARVRAAGFHRHIAKPFDPQELVAAVRAAL